MFDPSTVNSIITYLITLIATLIFAMRILEKKWNRRDACLVAKDAIEVLRTAEPTKAVQLENFLEPFCNKYWKKDKRGESK